MIDAKTLGATPAHPYSRHCSERGTEWVESVEGMTLRQHYVGLIYTQFLHGAVIPPGFDATEQLAHVAKIACEAADALLAELAKEPQS